MKSPTLTSGTFNLMNRICKKSAISLFSTAKDVFFFHSAKFSAHEILYYFAFLLFLGSARDGLQDIPAGFEYY